MLKRLMGARLSVKLTLLAALAYIVYVADMRRSEALAPIAGLALKGVINGALNPINWALLGVAGLELYELAVEDSNGNQVRIPVSKPVAAPPAPGTTPPGPAWETDTGAFRSATPGAVCDAVTAQAFTNIYSGSPTFWTTYTATVLTPPSGDCGMTTCCKMQGSTGSVFFPLQQVTVCPSGYSGPSGGSCTLSNARLAQPDNKRDFAQSGGNYAPLEDADPNVMDPYVDGNVIRVTGSDASGQKTVLQVEKTETGTRITQITQTVDAAQNTMVRHQTAEVSESGVPQKVAQHTQPGYMTQNPTTGEVTVTSSPDGSVGSGEQPCSPGGAGERNCELTQQQIKEALTAKPDSDKPSDPTARTSADIKGVMPSLGLTGWTIPAHASTCPTMTFNVEFLGWDGVSVAEHCNLMDATRDTAAIWLDLMWLLVALFVILTA